MVIELTNGKIKLAFAFLSKPTANLLTGGKLISVLSDYVDRCVNNQEPFPRALVLRVTLRDECQRVRARVRETVSD